MSMIPRLARKSAKIVGVGGGLCGSVALANLYINDDVDDIAYYSRRWLRSARQGERKKVVVLGSGWGSISFVTKLDPRLYDVTVVSPRPFFFYTPLLCGSTTGTVSPGAIIEPIRDRAVGCSYLNMACREVDLENKKVVCASATPGDNLTLDYDHLVVSVGAQPNTFGIPGVDKHAKFLKEIEHGRDLRKHIFNRLEEADIAITAGDVERAKRLLNVVVVGGGPTGVEFCGELIDYVKRDLSKQFPQLKEHFKLTLVEALPSLLTMFQKTVGQHVLEHLTNQGVDVRLNAMVKEAQQEKVFIKMKSGETESIDFGTLVWVAGVGMRPFTRALCHQIGADAGQTDRRGLLVDECLRVKGTRLGEVFAIGDCAVSGKPPTAQVAAQQGKYLGRMFREGSENKITDPEAPGFKYMHQGTMAYIGSSKAATELFPTGLLKLGKSSITDYLFWRSLYGEVDHIRVMGYAGFAVWRSVYFTKMYSIRCRWCVASDWMRTAFFGRPASSSAQGTANLL